MILAALEKTGGNKPRPPVG
ncbi:hypothetical protein ACNKHL_24465 [Shigella flexneri]